MVVMDAGTLLLLFRPNVDVPRDPATGRPVEAVKDRLDYLVKTLTKKRTKIVVPTPALSEMLVRAGSAGIPLVEEIGKHAVFRIVPFDTLAAIEVAAMTRTAIEKGDKRGGLDAPWTKVKYDRQIVAIAKVTQAQAIYSDDEHIEKLGITSAVQVISIASLPLPPEEAQGKLDLPSPETAITVGELTDEAMDEMIAEAANE